MRTRRKSRVTHVLRLALLVPMCGFYQLAGAQAYPSHAIRMVVPFPPAGGTDLVARSISQALSQSFGQQVIVDNRSGAGGTIGAAIAAKAAPDGYTLLLVTVAHAINASLYSNLSYDLTRDFVAISQVASVPLLIVVHPSLPVRSTKELIALARAKPDQLIVASSGSGTPTHLAAEIFRMRTGAGFVHVPYKGANPAITDLLAGYGHVMFANLAAVLSQVKANRLRALAVTSGQRSNALPETPTVSESAVPGFEVIQWYGIMSQRGTPSAVIDKLHLEIDKAAGTAQVRQRLNQEGAMVVKRTTAAFDAFIRSEIALWSKAVKASHAKVD
jgi:tripartite-type tricarboxylate transporter receptor subunit TctC